MTNRVTSFVGVLLALTILSVGTGNLLGQTPTTTHNSLTEAEIRDGWRLLFDGRSTSGWRVYGGESMSEGWQVVDGALTHLGNGRDIVTTEQFGDFELRLEWNVEPEGNSGIFYRAVEGSRRVYHSAPEMQLLDDERHVDGRSPLTSAGSNYGLHAPPRGVVKPAGEWNTARIVVMGSHVEHWLNGVKVVEYELWSDEWEELVANSKFVEWPEYGRARSGFVGLQDHGSWAAFRNIKIRPLS